MSKKVLLIVAHEGFQPVEYGAPRHVLEEAGVQIIIASNKPGEATAAHTGQKVPVDMVLSDVKPAMYDGMFFIGGPGALHNLDNTESYWIAKEASESGKPWGAICISPRILAKAGVLRGRRATGWDGDGDLDRILIQAGAISVREPVVIDGNLITANGPAAGEDFGKAILKAISK